MTTTPQSMSDLPELPEPSINTANHASVRVIGYTADQLREYGRLCRATAEQAGKVEGAVAWECKIVGRDVGWHACTKEQHDNIKLTGFYNGPGGAMCEARELFAQPVVIGYDDASGRDRDWSAKPPQPAATQQPYGWVLTGPCGSAFIPATHRHVVDATLKGDACTAVAVYDHAAPVSPSREVEGLVRKAREALTLLDGYSANPGDEWMWCVERIEDALDALAPVQENAP